MVNTVFNRNTLLYLGIHIAYRLGISKGPARTHSSLSAVDTEGCGEILLSYFVLAASKNACGV